MVPLPRDRSYGLRLTILADAAHQRHLMVFSMSFTITSGLTDLSRAVMH